MKAALESALRERSPLLLDGGLATELERRGQDLSTRLWSAALLRDNPDAIVAAHRAFLEAGAEVIASASYQASHEGYAAAGQSAAQADRLLARAVELARQAVAGSAGHREGLVAASIGPWGAAQADGSEYRGRYPVGAADLEAFHGRRLQVLDACAPDLLALETIPDRVEAGVLARLLRCVETPAWISFQCADDRHAADGTPVRELAALFAAHPRVLALGVNCVDPDAVERLLAECRAGAPDKILVAYPNSGERWDPHKRAWIEDGEPPDLAERAADWLAAGARWIGGCCRVGPDKIARMRPVLDTWPA